MNKRIIHIVLAGVVLFVWGRIGSNIINRENTEKNSGNALVDTFIDRTSDDHYELQIDQYADPFGINRRRENAEYLTETVKPQEVSDASMSDANWERIQFKGSLTNIQRDECVVVLEVDDEPFLVSIGTDILGYKVESVYSDSVAISYGRQKKHYLKTSSYAKRTTD